MVQCTVGKISFYDFIETLFSYFNADKIHYSVKKGLFLKFFGGIREFFNLIRDLKKRRKVVVHHTLTGGSAVTGTVSEAMGLWDKVL
jgi:hypothetical protein